MEKLMMDSDVLINWLTQEEENKTNRKLWLAPSIILELGEKEQLENHTSLLSVFEIRFVLRRKKRINPLEIERDIQVMQQIVKCHTPSDFELDQANLLQSEQLLDPFDSIILTQTISLQGILISRDRHFLNIASQYVKSYSPEEYIEHCLG
jgi:PIN domain nuclease of toxin-antitoxin system